MYGHYQTRRGSQAPNARWHSDDEAEAARSEVKRRRARGDTYAAIASDLGVSINTVRKLEHGHSYSSD